jgi:tetratricopeptide (TPR) repeat protein
MPGTVSVMAESAPETDLRRLEELIDGGLPGRAVELGQGLVAQYPDDGVVAMLHGIALTQAGQVEQGLDFLRRSTMLRPEDPETFHNLAVQLLDQGDRREAASYAKQALSLDPGHSRATELIARCEEPQGEAPFELSNETPIRPGGAGIRSGPDSSPESLLGLGPAWTVIGTCVFWLSVGQLGLLIFHPFVNLSTQQLGRDPLSIFCLFLYVFVILASGFWTTVDVIDRRQKFLWLLPVWVCGLAGLDVLPLALYLFLGRKIPNASTGA